MKKCVRVYIEGGGTGRVADNDFRRGWKVFLRELHEKARRHGYQALQVVRGKGRNDTFRRFCRHAVRQPGDLSVLVVDAEKPIPDGVKVWDVVLGHKGQRWERPAWASEGHLYLMVAFVETWLLTDQDALARYFGRGFDRRPLPTTGLEGRSKSEVEKALRRATWSCKKGPYRHGQAHEVIELVRPGMVRSLSHGRRLFEELSAMLVR